MTNEEIRLCIERTAAECIHSLTLLASHMTSLDDFADDDVQIIQDAARDVAGILISLRDDFADAPYTKSAPPSPILHAAMVDAGLTKRPE